MELRKFRDMFPDEFRIVKNLPLRARVGRADLARTCSSVAFIRDSRRDGFFRVGRGTDPRIEEISIVEAAREFRAPDPAEPSLPLPDHHHDDIRDALQSFRDLAAAAATADKALDNNPGPNERRALEFLDAFLKLNILSDSEKDLVRAAKLAVRKAKFQKLQKEINQLQKSVKQVKVTPSVLADKLLALLQPYPLQQEAALATDANKHPSEPINTAALPKIILSESFIHDSDADFDAWIKKNVGIAKGMPSTDKMMRETRGED